jgi:HEPN domain-containing protein
MDEAKRQHVRAWLLKARDDLAAARKLAAAPDRYLEIAVYHCQQAAEKAVKGFLVFHDYRYAKTHDIEALVKEATAFESGFASWDTAAASLTEYATATRYPDEAVEVDLAQFEQAWRDADGLLALVLRFVPNEAHP